MTSREPGTVLDGKYEIVQRLGSGGMGEVHLVRHLHLQELRVVKILRQDLAADPSAQARFLREARLATQIKHPNVAILYDFSRLPDGSFYMVWEHIEGHDVGGHLRKHGPFPVPVAIQLGIQALRGLEAIHSTGVIHRDVSPDNLMITEDRRGQFRIKIIDLGLAKHLEPGATASMEITQVGMFMGKLQYCSPEQAATSNGETLDRRSDLYSFALVLYEMLVGLPPFESESQHGFIFKRLSEDPLPLAGRNPRVAVPVELDRVVRRGLERERDKRYNDAVVFIEALEKIGRALTGAETQEIPIARAAPPAAATTEGSSPGTAAAPSAPGSDPGSRPASGPTGDAASPSTPVSDAAPEPPRYRSSSELSRAERIDLLAQIERAGRRNQEGTQILGKAEVALAAGQLAEARELLGQIELSNPRAAGVEAFRWRLQQVEEQAAAQRRTAETEQVLAGYLQRRQLPLARLALETLLELSPGHPRRAELEGALERLARDLEQQKRAEKALEAGRAALAQGDFRAARRELEVIVRNDTASQPGARAEAFRAELAAAERAQRQGSEVEERRKRLEQALATRQVAEAERELEQLSGLEVTRVTLDAYRAQLEEVRSASTAKARTAEFERRYKLLFDAEDWYGAREIAREMERDLPGHPRAGEMFAEVDRREAGHRRQQTVAQGIQQIETFIAQKDAPKAEMALRILLQMDPDNKNRKRLEKAVRGLAGR
ncbi:MAG TPA: protein kinase [Thermoanaerobaculia bacterium]|nr:protein kinase [Thermoanaerobaculia bacterium]